MNILKNIKSALQDYFSRKKQQRLLRLKSRRKQVAAGDINVREYDCRLWLSYKDIPLVPADTFGSEGDLLDALEQARESYTKCVLEDLIK